MRFLVALALSVVAAGAADTNTASLEGTTWKAKTWSGAAARGGDPDPYDDESTVEIAGGKISWTNGGGGGPYAVASLPATARSPDNEEMKFSLNSDGDLVVEFGYAAPATIVYARQGAPSTSATDGCPDALWTVAKEQGFEAMPGGPEQIVVVGGTQGLNVGSDVCIELNDEGKNVDVQVYDRDTRQTTHWRIHARRAAFRETMVHRVCGVIDLDVNVCDILVSRVEDQIQHK